MIEAISAMFSYSFMLRALTVGVLVSVCAALLGVSLVLKRYSMIGDGLSHVGFGALAVAAVTGTAELATAIPVVVAAAVLLLRISENSKIKGDGAIALISTGSLALGVMVISMTSGVNTDIMNYLFGSILAMSDSDTVISAVLCIGVLIAFLMFYNRMFAVTFDEGFARATGSPAGTYNTLLACLTAVIIVLGMRMMGALLISSLIIFPPLTAMRLCRTFRGTVICSGILSGVCFILGMFISFFCSTPTGASVVAVNIFTFALFSLIAWVKVCRVKAALS